MPAATETLLPVVGALLRAATGGLTTAPTKDVRAMIESLGETETAALAFRLMCELSVPVESQLFLLRQIRMTYPGLLERLEASGSPASLLAAREARYLTDGSSDESLETLLSDGAPLDPRVVEAAIEHQRDGHNPALLRRLLAQLRLGAADYPAAQRLARRVSDLSPAGLTALGLPELRVAILGDVTTKFLQPLLQASLLEHGVNGTVQSGDFDHIEVLVLSPESWLRDFRPDVVVLLSSSLAMRPSEAEGWHDLLRQRAELCRLITERFSADTVVTNFELLPEHTGPQGTPAWLAEVNAALRHMLPERSHVFDLGSLVAEVGVDRWFDLRMWGIARQSFGLGAAPLLADRLGRFLRALVEPPVKLIVADLDGTLWGDIAAEVGAEQIILGGNGKGVAYLRLQRYLRDCVSNGFLLAIASKNAPEIAREPFLHHPEMILKLEDLVDFECSFNPKSVVVPHIAKRLSLGLQNVLFLDDSPHERAEMRQQHPEVIVPEWPASGVAGLPALLARSGWLARVRLSEEDRHRTRLYREERFRVETAARFSDVEEFLNDLGLVARLTLIGPENLERVGQLVQKTNQFNLTTRRRTRLELEELIARPGAYARALYLEDRHGAYGLTGAMIAVPPSGETGPLQRLVIDTWVMSCRIMGKTVECAMFADLLRFARDTRAGVIEGVYQQTSRNAAVASLYEELGFTTLGFTTDARSPEEQRFVFNVSSEPARPNRHVKVVE
jgi:FkbH-like protein